LDGVFGGLGWAWVRLPDWGERGAGVGGCEADFWTGKVSFPRAERKGKTTTTTP